MSSAFYQENRKMRSNMYEPQTALTQYDCQGKCTCNLGYRTQYDKNQLESAISGQRTEYPVVGYARGWPI